MNFLSRYFLSLIFFAKCFCDMLCPLSKHLCKKITFLSENIECLSQIESATFLHYFFVKFISYLYSVTITRFFLYVE